MLPLYKKIKDSLLEDIKSNTLHVGDRISSEWELSRNHKVSRSTVTRALDILGKEGFLSKVAGVGTFVAVPKPTISLKRTGRIAFVFASERQFSGEEYHYQVFEAVKKETQREAIDLLFSLVSNNDDKESIIKALTGTGDIDGMILSPTLNSRVINEIIKTNIPVALYGNEFRGIETDVVIPDNAKGGYDLTKYLIKLGHKKIAFASGKREDTRFDNRFAGYKQALKEAGLDFDENLLWHYYEPDSVDKEILTISPTAIFGANDAIAMGIIKAIQRLGKKVPEDISVAGFDDRIFASYTSPALTTVRIPKEEMGKEAIRLLLERINNPGRLRSKVILPTELVIRNSCREMNK